MHSDLISRNGLRDSVLRMLRERNLENKEIGAESFRRIILGAPMVYDLEFVKAEIRRQYIRFTPEESALIRYALQRGYLSRNPAPVTMDTLVSRGKVLVLLDEETQGRTQSDIKKRMISAETVWSILYRVRTEYDPEAVITTLEDLKGAIRENILKETERIVCLGWQSCQGQNGFGQYSDFALNEFPDEKLQFCKDSDIFGMEKVG